MKKIFSLILTGVMLMTLVMNSVSSGEEFNRMNDPNLRGYIGDTLYLELVSSLNSEDYFVSDVQTVYISQEYIDELAFNSEMNVFFGYSLADLDAQFQGTRYIFTLGDDGETTVKAFEGYDDTYDRVIRNVAIGTGVILVCVTVSVVTAGAGAPACSMIFAVAAKSAAKCALSGAVLGGVSAGVVTGIKTGDMGEALKAAAVSGSEAFKWGAITGAVAGGASEAIKLKNATLNGLTMNEAAAIQKESGYPLDVIREFKSMDQYEICKDAGLLPQMVDGKIALVRNVDMSITDEFGRTNLQRMEQGLAAIDPSTGESFQLHHIGQKPDSTLAILSRAEHMQNGNNSIWHEIGVESKVDHNAFNLQRSDFWKDLAKTLSGGVQ